MRSGDSGTSDLLIQGDDINGYDSDPETHTYQKENAPRSRKNLMRPSNQKNILKNHINQFNLFTGSAKNRSKTRSKSPGSDALTHSNLSKSAFVPTSSNNTRRRQPEYESDVS